mmetsp:Transcript_121778/g.345177  ORF Transcript_121778/g.345177 Transcript_121778/m.345177 type:complete len:203 (+) Transcript_121778:234-842(+)
MNELLEGRVRCPAHLLLRLFRVAEQRLHLGGSEVLLGDLHHHLARLLVDALLRETLAAPHDGAAHHLEGQRNQVPHAVLVVRRDHKVLRLLLLQHHPHRLHVVLRVPPVPLRVQVPEHQLVPLPGDDLRHRRRHLLGHEGPAAARRLVVEEDPVAREHVVGLAVVRHDPVPVELRTGIRRAWVEWRRLLLRDFLHQPVQLRR